MKYINLSEAVSLKTVSEDARVGVFEVDGLYTGYGLTLGNALRRVLLSSLPGAAITHVKIKGVGHEFTTIPNVREDVVEISLNLKKIRFRIHTDEPQTLTLKVKGDRAVTAADIKTTTDVDVVSPDAHIATITTKSGEVEMELTVERGLGYVPVEARKMEKLPIGVVALDALFSPVTKANFTVENMRVGDRTDYNKLTLTIETDGSISPSSALKKAADILQEHFGKVTSVSVIEAPAAPEPKKARKKAKEE